MTQEQIPGQSVTSLQMMLRTVAQVVPSQPTVVPDGVYGEQTMRAVSEFQRQHGMESTGVTDFDTWQAIVKEYESASVEVFAAAPLEIELDCGQVLLPGSRNRHICLIQGMLMALADDYKELCEVHATGVYDEPTQKAVKWLQNECGSVCSGIFSKSDWKTLTGLYTAKIGNGEKDLQP